MVISKVKIKITYIFLIALATISMLGIVLSNASTIKVSAASGDGITSGFYITGLGTNNGYNVYNFRFTNNINSEYKDLGSSFITSYQRNVIAWEVMEDPFVIEGYTFTGNYATNCPTYTSASNGRVGITGAYANKPDNYYYFQLIYEKTEVEPSEPEVSYYETSGDLKVNANTYYTSRGDLFEIDIKTNIDDKNVIASSNSWQIENEIVYIKFAESYIKNMFDIKYPDGYTYNSVKGYANTSAITVLNGYLTVTVPETYLTLIDNKYYFTANYINFSFIANITVENEFVVPDETCETGIFKKADNSVNFRFTNNINNTCIDVSYFSETTPNNYHFKLPEFTIEGYVYSKSFDTNCLTTELSDGQMTCHAYIYHQETYYLKLIYITEEEAAANNYKINLKINYIGFNSKEENDILQKNIEIVKGTNAISNFRQYDIPLTGFADFNYDNPFLLIQGESITDIKMDTEVVVNYLFKDVEVIYKRINTGWLFDNYTDSIKYDFVDYLPSVYEEKIVMGYAYEEDIDNEESKIIPGNTLQSVFESTNYKILMIKQIINKEEIRLHSISAIGKIKLYLGYADWGISSAKVYSEELTLNFYDEIPAQVNCKKYPSIWFPKKLTTPIKIYGILPYAPTYNKTLSDTEREKINNDKSMTLQGIDWTDYSDLLTKLYAGETITLYGVLDYQLSTDDPNYNPPSDDEGDSSSGCGTSNFMIIIYCVISLGAIFGIAKLVDSFKK